MGSLLPLTGTSPTALVATARAVVSESGPVQAVGITDQDDSARYDARLHEAVKIVQSEHGVLVLTDMFGGTPSNVGLTLHQEGKVEVLTGANLPMLIKAMQLSTKGSDLAAASRQVKEYGKRAISIASEVLGASEPVAKEENPS